MESHRRPVVVRFCWRATWTFHAAQGEGYIDSEDKLAKIYDAVDQALEAVATKDEKK